jgi:hypothetical protein
LHPFRISFDILYNSFNNRTEFQTDVENIGFNAFELRLCRAEGVRLNAEGDVLLSLFSLAAAMETVENRKNGLHTVPTACSHPLFPL